MKVANNTDRDLSSLQKILTSFLPYAKERLGYDKPCCVNFVSDVENSKKDFGKTAYYDPSSMEIIVYVDGRHPKDMLRSISHELVHHTQNCRGDFDFQFETKPGYAQNNQKLRELEAEAYLLGNGFLVRDFEDSIKLGDLVLMEWKDKKKNILKEFKDVSSVERIKKLPQTEKFLEVIKKSKIDDQKEVAQLTSWLLQTLGVNPESLKKVVPLQLADLKDDLNKGKKEMKEEKLKNKEKADLDKDGTLSSYEEKRGKAIEAAMEDSAKGDNEKGDVKEHYITRSEIVGNELMKRWFSKK
jgi:hypothetical protein